MGRFGGMEENKKSASPKKNCAYGSLDSIVSIKGGMSLPVVTCHNRPPKKNRGKVTASRGWFWLVFGRMD